MKYTQVIGYTQIISWLVIMMFLTGCGLYNGDDELTGSSVVEEVKETASEVVEEVKETVKDVLPEHDADVKALMEKSEDSNNYQYNYDGSIMASNGIFYPEESVGVFIKGEKVRKTYLAPIKIDGAHYSDIYLIDGKAFGICSTKSVLCEEEGMAKELRYASQELKMTPLDLIQNVPYNTKVVGTETFDGRKLVILAYKEDNQVVKLSVDQYYGLPAKKIVYEINNGEEVIVEKHYFRDLAVGNVKNADVSL